MLEIRAQVLLALPEDVFALVLCHRGGSVEGFSASRVKEG
jgi:hypothetical protein